MAKKRARKPGPKPKPAEELRSESIRIVCTPAEKQRIADASRAAKRAMSDFIRLVALEEADRLLGPEE